MVFLGDKLTETAELADIVLPLRQHAQRFDFPMNSMRGWVNGDQWYYTLRQPVLSDETEARHPVEIYMELARRLGSSQSRVSKLEKADPTVTLDLMIRSMLAAGATSRDIAATIASTGKRGRPARREDSVEAIPSA